VPRSRRELEQARRLREALVLTDRSLRQALGGVVAMAAALQKLRAAVAPLAKGRGRGRAS
jgi:hypothetical protein